MECRVCREENPPGATECRACGAALEASARVCPSCGQENPPQARFCSRCGLDLAPEQGSGDAGQEWGVPGEPSLGEAGALAHVEYRGFQIRAVALGADTLVLFVAQLVLSFLGDPGVFGFVGGFAYYILFTGLKGQTPGKMMLGIKVVNQRGEVPGIWRAVLREGPGKFLSGIALGLGYAWAGWDERKQAWHDKIASTFVVRTERRLGRTL